MYPSTDVHVCAAHKLTDLVGRIEPEAPLINELKIWYESEP